MAQAQRGPGGTSNNVLYSVFVRGTWSDAWQYAPYLQPLSGNRSDIHGDWRAQFALAYGNIAPEDAGVYAARPPRQDRNLYVCVQAMPNFVQIPVTVWVGVIPQEQVSMLGTQGTTPAGRQTVTAYGLDWLLSRRFYVDAPVVLQGSPDPPAETDYRMISDVPVFNRRSGLGKKKANNRSNDVITRTGPPSIPETYGFTAGGQPWTHQDIIEHLLVWTDTWSVGPDVEPHFTFTAPPELMTFINTRESAVDPNGRSVRDIIRDLLSRKRGMTAKLRWTEDGDGFPIGDVEIAAKSLTGIDLPFLDKRLPANLDTVWVFLDTDPEPERVVVSYSETQRYDKIRAIGERVVSCFSAAGPDRAAELNIAPHKPDWPNTRKVEYQGATDAQRRRPRFDKVFRQFKLGIIGEPFEWMTVGTEPPQWPLNPALDFDGIPSDTDNVPTGDMGLHMLDWLPIEKRSDVLDEDPVAEFDKPFAIVELNDSDEGPRGIFINASDPPDANDTYEEEDPQGGETHSATVTALDDGLRMDVKFHKAAHVLGLGEFTADAGKESAVEPAFDYERMILTVAVELDRRVFAEIDTGSSLDGFTNRILRIPVPDAHLWFVAPSTISGIDASGALAFYSGPRTPRNDYVRLREVVELAALFFGQARATVKIVRKNALPDLDVGQYVQKIMQGYQQLIVGTVVTDVAMDFRAQTTTTTTSHFNLEFGTL